MREILFKGKTRTGNWIEGFLFHKSCDVDYWCISKSPISANDYSEILGDYEEIIPETVGQYTGLTDKSGKKILRGIFADITVIMQAKTYMHLLYLSLECFI